MKNKVLIIGGYHKAINLSNSLLNKGYIVTIINKNYEDCLKLAENDRLKVINGDGSRLYILEESNAVENDIVISLTKYDEDNLMICQLCKKKFGIKKTVSIVNDPNKIELFYKLGVDSVVCTSNIITNILEQHAYIDKMETILPISYGKICINKLTVHELDFCSYKKVFELNLPKDVIIACILRKDSSVVPGGDTIILPEDVIVLISSEENKHEAMSIILGREKNEFN